MLRSPIPARPAVLRRATLWLLFLAPFFYATYGAANWFAATRPYVPNLAFEWESRIPFIAWTILPYWSINLFYAIALFVNDAPEQVDRLARRYLTAQMIAVSCFFAFPLRATFDRPETSGLPGMLFDILGGFDKPFNQAPSLHIALLVIIWGHFRRRFRHGPRILWHVWCLLIGVSVLTTWQHHVIDIPTGAMLGLFALWLWPHDRASPAAGFRLNPDRTAQRLALGYGAAALAFLAATILTTLLSAAGLILLWPAIALAIVAFGYAGAGSEVFQKDETGSLSPASRFLLLPYRAGVRLNIWAWTRRLPPAVAVRAGVHLGRFPTAAEASAYRAVLDLTAELPRSTSLVAWHAFPSLDLLPLEPAVMTEAADLLERLRKHGPVLVCCALGFQRSASIIACWLVATGLAADAAEAVRFLELSGRRVALAPATLAASAEAGK
ncbi:MAG: phosphatase PAP2/dual specificity phosphatase family protein [Alphaproteobacteria bacterium]|nr:phosphatase PAP2/dual specificity phosphatase family protein [Alphaproteobacteria bacterium]